MVEAVDVQLGRSSARDFTINEGQTYTARTTGNVTPASSFSVNSSGSVTNVEKSLTGNISTAVPTNGYADTSNGTNDYFVTVESNFDNLSGRSFADSVKTTVTVQTTDTSGNNKASGTTTNGRD